MKRNKDGMIIHESFKKNISMESYEEICDVCKGHRWYYNQWLQRRVCENCKSSGKIDWIDKIKNNRRL